MTNIEEIKLLKDRLAFRCRKGIFLADAKENEVDAMAIRALEKEMPKFIIKDNNGACWCKICRYCLGDYEIRKRFHSQQNYCPLCGQRIDWGD